MVRWTARPSGRGVLLASMQLLQPFAPKLGRQLPAGSRWQAGVVREVCLVD